MASATKISHVCHERDIGDFVYGWDGKNRTFFLKAYLHSESQPSPKKPDLSIGGSERKFHDLGDFIRECHHYHTPVDPVIPEFLRSEKENYVQRMKNGLPIFNLKRVAVMYGVGVEGIRTLKDTQGWGVSDPDEAFSE